MRSAVRESDTAARVGGDGFLAILTGVIDGEAPAARTRLERALAEPIPYFRILLRCPASVGLAVLGEDGDHATSLLHAANHAMYSEKARRRVPH